MLNCVQIVAQLSPFWTAYVCEHAGKVGAKGGLEAGGLPGAAPISEPAPFPPLMIGITTGAKGRQTYDSLTISNSQFVLQTGFRYLWEV